MNEKAAILLGLPGLDYLRPALADGYDVIGYGNGRPGIKAIATSARGVDMALVDQCPDLALIAMIGTGHDRFDLADLRRRGIVLTNTPAVNSADVADLAVAMTLALVRGVVTMDHGVRSDTWCAVGRPPPPRSMSGLAIGIVGMGAIGEQIARRLAPFDVRLAWWGPRIKSAVALPRAADLLELARISDVLILAARTGGSAPPLVDGEVLAALGKDGIIVNVARGSLIDEHALRAALRAGRLAGAALDVFLEEPPSARQWGDVPNTILSPHVGGYTVSALAAMRTKLRANIDSFFAGHGAPDRVN